MDVTVLVIGSNGQDGSILCDLLDADNQAYIAVSRSETRLPDKSTSGPVDLSIPTEAASFLNEFKPSAIVHLAAIHAPSGSMARMGDERFDEMVKCHVDISRNILDWQVENADSKSIFALSSQMFSADDGNQLVSLESEVKPTTKYGETKGKCWELIKQYRNRKGVNACGLILFNHTSDRSKPEYLFPEIAKQLNAVMNAEKKFITIRDAAARIDIFSAYELGEGIMSCLKSNGPQDYIFSSGKHFSIRSIIEETVSHLRLSELDEIRSTKLSNGNIPIHGDISKTTEALGWTPKLSPSEILSIMVEKLND
jgi:nucleoside-diphosphate-sugar epimerase